MKPFDQKILEKLDQLRTLTPAEGASRRAVSRARQSVLEQPIVRPWYSFARRIPMIARIAACITLVAALGIVPLSRLWRSDGESALLAQMVENVRTAKNISLRFTGKSRTTIAGKKMPFNKSVYREWIDASGSSRQEMDGGLISVVSWAERKVMQLNKQTKTAVIISIPKNEPFENVYVRLKNTDYAKYEKLEEKLIAGRKAIGFVAPDEASEKQLAPGRDICWIDLETKLPIRLESSRGSDKDNPDYVVVIDQIVFDDPKVAPSLFEIKVPEGYTLQQEPLMKFSKIEEQP